ncbi:MAG: alpha/beta hydrolase [Anaerolineae bacterium]|nr:alpha/beta hydrolase [Anaerolineae bacterium]
MASWQGRVLKTVLKIQRRLSQRSGARDVAEHRASIEKLCRFFKPIGPIRCEPVEANGVPAEWVIPEVVQSSRAILFIHGGSFVAGSIASHRTLAGNVAIASKTRALLLDYRLAPEHPFPAAVEDVVAAYEWLLSQGLAPSQVVAAGDSAGGNLALALLIYLRDRQQPMPAGGVGLCPAPDLSFSGESVAVNLKKDIMLDVGEERTYIDAYLNGVDPRTPLASPIYADLRGLPPLLMQVGSDEILLPDVERFAEKARAAGVEATLEVWPEMQHDWQMAAKLLPEGRQAIEHAGAFVERVLSG